MTDVWLSQTLNALSPEADDAFAGGIRDAIRRDGRRQQRRRWRSAAGLVLAAGLTAPLLQLALDSLQGLGGWGGLVVWVAYAIIAGLLTLLLWLGLWQVLRS